MKQVFFLIAIFTLATNLGGCKSKKQAVATSTTDTTNMTEKTGHTYRIIVSFISKGTGVNKDKVESFLSYIESHPKKPAYEKIQWGREGEMDFCMQLDELNKHEQVAFVKKIQTDMKGVERVFITENTICTHQKR